MPKIPKSWDDRYGELKEFFQSKGHSNTSSKTGQSLHGWTVQQRAAKDRLTPAQVAMLDELQFDWETNQMKLQRVWDEMLDLLNEYKKEHGDTRVKQHGTFRGKNLGKWCGSQRSYYKHNKLPAHRVEKLEIIGFEWIVDERFLWKQDRNNQFLEDAWNERFQDLCRYKKEHGNTLVPIGFIAKRDNQEEYDLGAWVCNQRGSHKEGKLQPKRKQKLDSIDFVFEISNDDPEASSKAKIWDQWFAKLEDFKSRNGTCNVPYEREEDPTLGRWVSKQRARYSKNNISSARIKKLEDLGFDWDPYEAWWNERIEQVRDFKREHGHCRIRCDGSSQLARWVNTVRSRRRQTPGVASLPLRVEQIEQLDELGFEWNPPMGQDSHNRTCLTKQDKPRRTKKKKREGHQEKGSQFAKKKTKMTKKACSDGGP